MKLAYVLVVETGFWMFPQNPTDGHQVFQPEIQQSQSGPNQRQALNISFSLSDAKGQRPKGVRRPGGLGFTVPEKNNGLKHV